MKITKIEKKEKIGDIIRFCFEKGYIYSMRELIREFGIDYRNYDELINKYFIKKKKASNKYKRFRYELHLKDEYKEKIFNFLKNNNND